MRIVSGVVKLNQRDKKEINLFLAHAVTNMFYGLGGSFGAVGTDKQGLRELKLAEEGLETIKDLLRELT